jgi:hypothetical protein
MGLSSFFWMPLVLLTPSGKQAPIVFVTIVGKAPLTSRSVASGYFPTTFKRRGKKNILAVTAHIPKENGIPKSYRGRVLNFLNYLGLPRKFSPMFFKRGFYRKYLSVLVQYFCLYSLNMRRQIKRTIRFYVRTVADFYAKLERVCEKLPPGKKLSEVRYSYLRFLREKLRTIWRSYSYNCQHLTLYSLSIEECFSSLFNSRF